MVGEPREQRALAEVGLPSLIRRVPTGVPFGSFGKAVLVPKLLRHNV